MACAAPAGYVVEADARVTADANRVVVMLPAGAVATGYRIFYGPPDALSERVLKRADFASSKRLFEFDVDGVDYTAIFPSGPQPALDASRLLVGADPQASQSRPFVVVATNASAPASDLRFFCRS